jgi:hypothetical protein
MEGTSEVSGQGNAPEFDAIRNQNDEDGWSVQLEGVNTDQNGWRVQETQKTSEPNNVDSITDENGQFKPEVSKVLNNFIGSMTIEMVKKQSPAQKISMDGDE